MFISERHFTLKEAVTETYQIAKANNKLIEGIVDYQHTTFVRSGSVKQNPKNHLYT